MPHKKITDIYSSACVRNLEQEYCNSRSAAVLSTYCVSNQGLGARIVSRIYYGGRRVVYTATVGAMLANNMALPAYADVTVSAGETSTGLIAEDSNIYVYGSTINTTANSGGTEHIYGGGYAGSAVINDGGRQIISGGIASSATLNSGGSQTVLNGGSAVSTTINSSGLQLLSSGGYASGTILENHGTQTVLSGGSSLNVIQNFYANINADVIGGDTETYITGYNEKGSGLLLSNGYASGFIINDGGYLNVSSGGSAINIVQSLGGNINAVVDGTDLITYISGTNQANGGFSLSKGVASGFIINSTGRQVVINDGQAYATTITSGGVQEVSAGGSASGTVLEGGSQNVASGAVVYNTVLNNGVLNVSSGAIVSGVEQDISGTVNITVYGGDNSTYVSGSNYNGYFLVQGGVAANLYISGGMLTLQGEGAKSYDAALVGYNASQIVNSGAVASDTSLSGATRIVSGEIVGFDAVQIISAGGSADGSFLNKYAQQIVSAGGIATNTEIDGASAPNSYSDPGSALQIVYAGGSASGTVVSRGGEIYVDGGNAQNITLSDFAYMHLSGGGEVSGVTVDGSSAVGYIEDGSAANITLQGGGTLNISNGAIVTDVYQSNGNVNIIADTADGTVVSGTNDSGEFSLSGGIASNFLISSGGSHTVNEGASSLDITQLSGGNIYAEITSDSLTKITGVNESGAFSFSSGVASNFIIYVNGTQEVSNNGSAIHNVIQGGYNVVFSGGAVQSTIIKEGTQNIIEGGFASDTLISNGIQYVDSGGSSYNTEIEGGMQAVYSGGIASGTEISSGGSQFVGSEGIADNTVLYSGASQTIEEGGSSINAVLYEGAMVNITVQSGDTTVMTGENQSGADFYYSNGVASNFIVSSGGFHNVLSGGSSYNVSQLSGGNINVEVDGTSSLSATYVSGINQNGDILTLENGIASNFIINSGGSHTVINGGSSFNVIQNSGGIIETDTLDINNKTVITGSNGYGNEFVVSSAYASNFVVYGYGNNFDVFSGAVAQGTILADEATSQWVQSGAVADGTHLLGSKSVQYIASGGSASNTQITGIDTIQTIQFGGSAVSAVLDGTSNIVLQEVLSGAYADGTVISGRKARQRIDVGGLAANAFVTVSGRQLVNGSAVNTTLQSGGSQYVYSGGSASNTIINDGGIMRVEVGGSAIDVVQNEGGSINTDVIVAGGTYITGHNQSTSFSLIGGVASGFILNSGGAQRVSSGGIADGTVINSGGSQIVSQYGSASGTVINHSGKQEVYFAVVDNTIISGGSQILHASAHANNTEVTDSGRQLVEDGGVVSNTILHSTAQQSVSNAQASGTIIKGGTQDIFNLASADSTTVSSGGVQNIYSGGSAGHTLVSSGGTVYLSSDGITSGAIIYDGGVQNVLSGGNDNDTTVSSGGLLNISLGAVVSGTVQSAGGNIDVLVDANDTETSVIGTNEDGNVFSFSNGLASNFIVNSGGSQTVVSGGIAKDTVLRGGIQDITAAGIAQNTILSAGTQNVEGVDSSSIISGGSQNVSSGGSVVDTVISGGEQNVYEGASVSNATVTGSGVQNIISGASVNGGIVLSGGNQNIEDGAVALSTLISGGNQNISGIASAVIVSGGSQNVLSGGSAVDTVISGGEQNVYEGASVSNAVISSGGSQNVLSGALASGVAVFDGGVQNVLSDGAASAALISSGGLQNVSGSAFGTILDVGGSQTVFTGGTAVNAILQEAVQTISGGSAVNTLLTSGSVQNILTGGFALSTVVSSGTDQNVSSGAIASGTIVLASGTQSIKDGGMASSAQINGGIQNILSGGIAKDTVINDGNQNIFAGGVASGNILNGGNVHLYGSGIIQDFTANGGLLTVYSDNTLSGNINLTNARVEIISSGGMKQITFDNISANNTIFDVNVDLENQTADKLKVDSSFTGGTNYIRPHNVASSAQETSGDGILMVEFAPGATAGGKFVLKNETNGGPTWEKGAYKYRLYKGTAAGVGENYYLRNFTYSDAFKTMLNVPLMNVMMARTGMNSLQKRLGELQDMNSSGAKQGLWVRTYYKNMTVNDLIKTDLKMFGAEGGYDWLFRADEPTKLYAGIMLGYLQANNIKTEKSDGAYDSGKGDSPSVGIYATLVNDNRWFVDIAARNFWTKLDMTNYPAGGWDPMIYKPSRNILAASIEAGKTFVNELEADKSLRFEPKAEVLYMNAAANKAKVTNGDADLSYGAADYITGKAAVVISYNTKWRDTLLIEPLFELAYSYDFSGKGEVIYDSVLDNTNIKGGTVEVNAGLNMQLAENLYWYALGSYEKGSKISAWGLNAGIRLGFGNGESAERGYKSKTVKERKSSDWEYIGNSGKSKKSSKNKYKITKKEKKVKITEEKSYKTKKKKKKSSFAEDEIRRMESRM